MRRRALPVLVLLMLLLLLLSGCSVQGGVQGRADAGGTNPATAPPLPTSGLRGEHIDLSAYRGAPVVIDFWGSWCGPCRAEQADLNSLAARYAARGVHVVGVDERDDGAQALAYQTQLKVPYPSVADSDESVAAAWDVSAPPTIVVVDPQGHLAGRFLGTVVGVDTLLDQLAHQ